MTSDSQPNPPDKAQPARRKRAANQVALRHVEAGEWQLVHPRCAERRREDIEEVETMIAAEEYEIARDELRWLLEDCHDCLAAHKLLGDLALVETDFKLARGHFGYVYQLVTRAIERAGIPPGATLPYRLPANQVFHQAGRGLLQCLVKLGKRGMARDVLARLLALDPRDPLNLRGMSLPAGDPNKRHRPKWRRGRK